MLAKCVFHFNGPVRCYFPVETTTLTITIHDPAPVDEDGPCPLAPFLHHGPLRTPRYGIAVAMGIFSNLNTFKLSTFFNSFQMANAKVKLSG